MEVGFTDMLSVTDAGTTRTGFPFNFSADDYAAELRFRDARDLQREIDAALPLLEALQYAALEHVDVDGTYDYVRHQLPAMLAELERKQRLLKAHGRDPLRPRWPAPDDRFRARIAAVRAAWPIERFCRELLLLELIPAGRDRFRARCPLPGHDDRTPSFSIDTAKNLAYCHGCHRGGDVLKLAQYALNVDRFTDALAALEREGGAR